MYRTAEINAIIDQAKQQRAEYIAAKVQGVGLPVVLMAVLSIALVQLAGGSSEDQAQQSPAVDVSAQNG